MNTQTQNTHGQSDPFFTRILTKLAPIRPEETKTTAAAFWLFFFMWAGYFAVRPVRETIATVIGRSATADLWIYTAAISVLVIPIYGMVVSRLRRQVFLPAIYAFVSVMLALVGVAFEGENVSPQIGKIFYVFISVVNLFIISVFWSYLLEIFNGAQTKRLFGVIAAGGSAGALVGPFISDLVVGSIGNRGILFLGAAFFVAAIVCQRVLFKVAASATLGGDVTKGEDKPIGGNPFAGVLIVLRSPYLLGIALFIVFISTVNTLLYFEQLRVVADTFSSNVERTRAFARIDWVVQSITVLSQIFITGRVTARFGVIALITLVPVAMVLGFLGLALNGTFAVFVVVLVLRRACEYAFIRPSREMLWAPLDKETKYKAKNTVDVPVYRGADALSAQATDAIKDAGVTAAGIAIIGAIVAALWAGLGWWLGKAYEKKTASNPTK